MLTDSLAGLTPLWLTCRYDEPLRGEDTRCPYSVTGLHWLRLALNTSTQAPAAQPINHCLPFSLAEPNILAAPFYFCPCACRRHASAAPWTCGKNGFGSQRTLSLGQIQGVFKMRSFFFYCNHIVSMEPRPSKTALQRFHLFPFPFNCATPPSHGDEIQSDGQCEFSVFLSRWSCMQSASRLQAFTASVHSSTVPAIHIHIHTPPPPFFFFGIQQTQLTSPRVTPKGETLSQLYLIRHHQMRGEKGERDALLAVEIRHSIQYLAVALSH